MTLTFQEFQTEGARRAVCADGTDRRRTCAPALSSTAASVGAPADRRL